MKKEWINFITVGLGTLFTWLFGVWDLPLKALITFISADYVLGLYKGYIFKRLSSDTGYQGLFKKSLIFAVLLVAVMVDRLSGTGQWIFRTATCFYYIGNEGISILENCAQLGAPIPTKLRNALIQLKQGQRKEVRSDEK